MWDWRSGHCFQEIETVVHQLAGVAEAAVVGRASGDDRSEQRTGSSERTGASERAARTGEAASLSRSRRHSLVQAK